MLGRVRVAVAGDGPPVLLWPSLLMTGSMGGTGRPLRRHAGIPGARFIILDDAAHLVALEVPERVNELIDGHLAAAS